MHSRKLCAVIFIELCCLATLWYMIYKMSAVTYNCNILGRSSNKKVEIEQWKGCPKAGDGLNSIMISAYFGGRLGNKIWSYLSAYAVARRYGLWFVVHNETLSELGELFENFSAHCLEELSQRCNFSLREEDLNSIIIRSQKSLLESIESPLEDQINLLSLPYHVVLTEEVLPWWREMHHEIRLKKDLRDHAQLTLHKIKLQSHNNSDINKILNVTSMNKATLEYVGVHVRRTDYLYHMVRNYPGAKVADERFFLQAMYWMRTQLKRPLAFVVVSDDLNWCREKLGAPDVYVVGNGNESNPHEDLAILGACNYSIFSYGTFGLTGALLTNGRYTLLYDTQNNTNTKEMEFATYMPGWHILDDKGREQYKPADRKFRFTFVKG